MVSTETYCYGVIPRKTQITPEYVLGSNGKDLYITYFWQGAELAYYDNPIVDNLVVKRGGGKKC